MSQLLITLNAPIVTGSPITRVAINIERGIPPDAEFAVEATNNANDAIPVWENATASVVGGFNHAFANTQAANGPAFNFRIFAKRGPSGQGGYINNVRYTFWTNTAATLIEIIRAEFGIDDMRDQITDHAAAITPLAPQTATAPIAQIQAALGGVPLNVTARLVATQEGSGEPSPDNVRAIAGRDVVDVLRMGKNLFSSVIEQGHIDSTTGSATGSSSTWVRTAGFIQVMPDSVYTLSKNNESFWNYMLYYDSNKKFISARAVSTAANRTFTTPSNCWFIRFRFYNAGAAITPDMIQNVQLELGPAATSYEPYAGQSYAIPLPETTYGLPLNPVEINVSRGVIALNSGFRTFDGAEPWALSGTTGANGTPLFSYNLVDGIIDSPSTPRSDILCSAYKVTSVPALHGVNAGECIMRTSSSGTSSQFYIAMPPGTTLDDAKAHISALYAAGTPLTVAYPINAPRILTIPPVLIPSLLGENNVYTDGGGDTTVEWRMDMQQAIDALQAQITALQALLTQP